VVTSVYQFTFLTLKMTVTLILLGLRWTLSRSVGKEEIEIPLLGIETWSSG
jgi:hypothetical protein